MLEQIGVIASMVAMLVAQHDRRLFGMGEAEFREQFYSPSVVQMVW